MLKGLDIKISKLLQSLVFLVISSKYFALKFFSLISGTLLLRILKIKKLVSENKSLISLDF